MDQRPHRIIPLLLGCITTIGILMWTGIVPSAWLTETEPFKRARELTGSLGIVDSSSSKKENGELTKVRADVRVMAHYMPWFKRRVSNSGSTDSSAPETHWEHWQWEGKETTHDPNKILENGQHDIASVHYPVIGPYDNHDPTVIEYHIITAKLAGIEAFMCNWYGPGTFTDESIGVMLPIAEKYQFRIGICFEEKALYPPYTKAKGRADLVNELETHLNHILQTHGDSPAFLTHKNKPLLFMFNYYGNGKLGSNLLSADEIKLARSRIEQDFLIVRNQINASQFPVADGAYVWCSDREKRQFDYQELQALQTRGLLKYRSAVASPGFDDSGVEGWGSVVRQIDRRGSDEYAENWRQAIEEQLDSVQVVTWNDFQEGTTIEPTVEYGFEFVDLTEQGVEMLTGRTADKSDNQLGLRIYQLRRAAMKIANQQAQDSLSTEIDDLAAAIFLEETTSLETRFDELEAKLKQLSQ